MSTYSNNPQQNHYILWFLSSLISFLLILVWGGNSKELPIIYDGLLLATFANLMYCIIVGLKK